MKRREFLVGSAGAAAASRAWGQRPDQAKLDRIGVMTLCFDPVLKGGTAREPDPKRTVDMMDFADMVADRYGIHHLELQSTDFDSTEPEFLQELRNRVEKAKSRIIQLNLEFENLNVAATRASWRLSTIDLAKMWINHAVALNCPKVMLNQDRITPEVKQAAIDTLRTICKYAASKNITVTMEPRWASYPKAPNVPWELLVEVMKASGVRAVPDCGNFPDVETRTAALPVLFQMTAGECHIKHFPEKFDTAEAIRVSKEAGFKGIYMIEERGFNSPDPYAGVQIVIDYLLARI
jgi:sugar phosphate isomerase/epimerase